MVATRRNYTRDEKAAYRERLERRYVEGVRSTAYRTVSELAARAAVTVNQAAPAITAAFGVARQSAQKMSRAFMDLGAAERMGLAVGRQLAPPAEHRAYVDEIAETFRNLSEAERLEAINGPWLTAEEILGMDSASPRPQTLEDLLDLPPTPIRQRELPEEWTQS